MSAVTESQTAPILESDVDSGLVLKVFFLIDCILNKLPNSIRYI